MKLMTHEVSRLKWGTDESVITVLFRWSFLKFRWNVKIPRLGSKFRGPRKTVGPTNEFNHTTVNTHTQSYTWSTIYPLSLAAIFITPFCKVVTANQD